MLAELLGMAPELPAGTPQTPEAVRPLFPRAQIAGAPWSLDWRDSAAITPEYQGYGGQAGYLNLESATDWTPYAGLIVADGYIGGYGDVPGGSGAAPFDADDELRAGSTIAWPTHCQDDGEAASSSMPLLYLEHESDIYQGAQLWAEPDPRMVFLAPPSYGEQTTPIPAVGY